MKVVRIKEIEGTERDVNFTGGHSIRAILEKDNMGFAVMKTIIPRGGPHHWHYPFHKEACYCIKGRGELTDLKTGLKIYISPDCVYLLDNHDDHTFKAFDDVVLISIFNPPLTGKEKHDENGHYPAPSNKSKAKEIVEAVNLTTNNYDAVEIVETLL